MQKGGWSLNVTLLTSVTETNEKQTMKTLLGHDEHSYLRFCAVPTARQDCWLVNTPFLQQNIYSGANVGRPIFFLSRWIIENCLSRNQSSVRWPKAPSSCCYFCSVKFTCLGRKLRNYHESCQDHCGTLNLFHWERVSWNPSEQCCGKKHPLEKTWLQTEMTKQQAGQNMCPIH